MAAVLFSGYMPVDFYNLNSAYGSVESLKRCIEEMHEAKIQVRTWRLERALGALTLLDITVLYGVVLDCVIFFVSCFWWALDVKG